MVSTSGMVTINCPSYHRRLTEKLWNSFLTRSDVDFGLLFGGRYFGAHRFLLDLFLSTDKLSECGTNMKPNDDCVVLESLLEFLYTGRSTVARDQLDSLLALATNSEFELLVDTLRGENFASSHSGNNQTESSDEFGANIQPEVVDYAVTERFPNVVLPSAKSDTCPTGEELICEPQILDLDSEVEDSNISDATGIRMEFFHLPEFSDHLADGFISRNSENPALESSGNRLVTAARSLKSVVNVEQECLPENDPILRTDSSQINVFSTEQPQSSNFELVVPKTEVLVDSSDDDDDDEIASRSQMDSHATYVDHHDRVSAAVRFELVPKLEAISDSGDDYNEPPQPPIVHKDNFAKLQVISDSGDDYNEPPQPPKVQNGSFANLGVISDSGDDYNDPTLPPIVHKDNFAKLLVISDSGDDYNEPPQPPKVQNGSFANLGVISDSGDDYNEPPQPAMAQKSSFAKLEAISESGDDCNEAPQPQMVHKVGGKVTPPASSQHDRPHKCNVCQKAFSSALDLRKHGDVHIVEKPFKCEVCDKTFGFARQLKVHRNLHTGAGTYSCQLCPRSFRYAHILKQHMNVHTGPYKCHVCRIVFSQSQSLKEHLLTHTGAEPFKCSFCQMTFSVARKLKNHVSRHTGDQPHKCHVCLKTFNLACKLRDHQRIHLSVKPHKCDSCEKTFSHPSNLKIHSSVHNGEKPYECQVCHKRLTRAYSLKMHMLLHESEKSHTPDVS